jgi:hypothetical protein
MELQVGAIGGYDFLGFSVTNWFSPRDGSALILLSNNAGTAFESKVTAICASLLRPGVFGK